MTLLLGADPVTLYSPQAGTDDHGWALPGTEAAWSGRGSLQAAPGVSAALAAGGGGHGPYGPESSGLAVLYLPPEAPVAEGSVAEVGGKHYALSQVRKVTDPRGTGDLDCWAATATGTDTWGA